MRDHAPQPPGRRAGQCQQAVMHGAHHLGHHHEPRLRDQVEIRGHGADQRIFDRQESVVRPPGQHRVRDVAKLPLRLGRGIGVQQIERLLAVGAGLPLECYPLVRHCIMVTGSDPCREPASGYIRVNARAAHHATNLACSGSFPHPVRESVRATVRETFRAAHVPALPRLRSPAAPPVGVPRVPRVRLVELRVTNALPVLDERLRGTKFVALGTRSILNSPTQTGMDFWSLNPYVGCEFGCSYCYARYVHRYVVERAHDAGKLSDDQLREFRGPHGWEAFEQRIFVKEQILAALERDLQRFFRSGGPTVRPSDTIVIGTATDPYQPAERRFRLTRQVLERLARCEGLNVGIITKSPLIARDVDVLRQLQERSDLEVYISLITLDARVIRQVEPRSPLPAVRLRALARLTAAGINAGLIVAPVLPGITDDRPHLEALFRAAREAGARFVHAGPLRLYAAVRDRFLPVLETHFPGLADRYRRAYGGGRSNAPRDYARALAARVKRLQARCGFPVNDGMRDRYRPRRPRGQGELGL